MPGAMIAVAQRASAELTAGRFQEAAQSWAVVSERFNDYASTVMSDSAQARDVQTAMRVCAFLLGDRRPSVERGRELDFAAQLLNAAGLRDDCGAEWTAHSLREAADRADDEARAARTKPDPTT